jgi:hypothetical protein
LLGDAKSWLGDAKSWLGDAMVAVVGSVRGRAAHAACEAGAARRTAEPRSCTGERRGDTVRDGEGDTVRELGRETQ